MPESPHELRPAEKVGAVIEALREHYGDRKRQGSRDPLDVLIRGVLSQNTSDTNSGRAWDSMMERFEGWADVAAAPQEELEDAIRSGGLAEQKARTIKSILEWLKDQPDGCSLDFMADMPAGEVERRLKSIKGVGVKTARLVLLFGFERPSFVVDTHVHRVSRRLGLIPENCGREKAHRVLSELVPPEHAYAGHLLMIQHGRETCRARKPLCEECPVEQYCLWVRGLVE